MNFHIKIDLGVDLTACYDELMHLGALMEKLAADVPGQQERQSITKVEELICSQENAPGTHKSPWEIEQITGTSRSSAVMLTDFLPTTGLLKCHYINFGRTLRHTYNI